MPGIVIPLIRISRFISFLCAAVNFFPKSEDFALAKAEFTTVTDLLLALLVAPLLNFGCPVFFGAFADKFLAVEPEIRFVPLTLGPVPACADFNAVSYTHLTLPTKA